MRDFIPLSGARLVFTFCYPPLNSINRFYLCHHLSRPLSNPHYVNTTDMHLGYHGILEGSSSPRGIIFHGCFPFCWGRTAGMPRVQSRHSPSSTSTCRQLGAFAPGEEDPTRKTTRPVGCHISTLEPHLKYFKVFNERTGSSAEHFLLNWLWSEVFFGGLSGCAACSKCIQTGRELSEARCMALIPSTGLVWSGLVWSGQTCS